jgi:hypothetical protein
MTATASISTPSMPAREKALVTGVHDADDGYRRLEAMIASRVAGATGPLFQTDAVGLFQLYLEYIPFEVRQHYNCACCRRFIETYGGLVRVGGAGLAPLLWDIDPPLFFSVALREMNRRVSKAQITGVFLNPYKVWGTPTTGPWTHFHGTPPDVFKHQVLTAHQVEAEKQQDFGMLCHAMADYPIAVAREAVRLLESGTLFRSEKAEGVAKWFLDLHTRTEKLRSVRAEKNMVWLAVATAPAGFCHVRSTVIAPLMDDIVAGTTFAVLKRKWDEKMDPMQYQRPTAPPSDGVIAQANKLVETLQSGGALARRFATVTDVLSSGVIWSPRFIEPATPVGMGVFDHLKAKPAPSPSVELPTVKMTWVKFRDTVLSKAAKIEHYVSNGWKGYYGLVTASDPTAAPILQWDGIDPDVRNPVSWYFKSEPGSHATQWLLSPGSWVPVTRIMKAPPHWQRPDLFKHVAEMALFALDRARWHEQQVGGGFFPESLKSDYHGIRSAMEAFSKSATVTGGSALDQVNGIAMSASGSGGLTFRVTDVSGAISTYLLDRWD